MIAYRSNCPLGRMLDVVGDKWTLLVLRDIVNLNKNTFKEIAQMPENIATNILSDRLLKLRQEGLIIKNRSEANKLVYYYHPTQKAIDLLPVALAMKDWSEKYLFAENETPTSIMPVNKP